MMFDLHRFWRMRGHGVHSPLAFRIITGVLRAPRRPYGYYRYPGEPYAQLMFRLVCEFAPRTVAADESLSLAEREAILMADSRIEIKKSGDGLQPPCADIWIYRYTPDPLPASGVVMIKNSGGVRDIPRSYGMMFHDGSTAILVMRPDLPAQTFPVTIE